MDPQQMAAFQAVVARMLSLNNEERSEAERQYGELSAPVKGSLLWHTFTQTNLDVDVRSMCLVLLRRVMTAEWTDLWQGWGPENQQQFCDQLLELTTIEPTPILRKRLADVVSEVARNTIDEDSGKQTWRGVILFLEQCSSSDTAVLRETAMLLIENVPNIFGVDQNSYLPGIKHVFQSSLLYAAESSVRTAALRAFVAFMCENEEDATIIHSLSDMVPAVIKVCQHVVINEDDDDVPLQCLSDLATSVPKCLRPYLTDIATLCLQTALNTSKDDAYRHSSLEVMVSLCESAAPMMCKQGAQYIPGIIEACLGMMTELDDNTEHWLVADTTEEDEEEETMDGFSSAATGETSLDRVAVALGGKACLTPVLQIVPQLIGDGTSWQRRYAGIMALSTIGEGCKRTMEPLIEQIVTSILPFLHDQHPRVRYAACNAIGQMASDFAPTLQKKCHKKVVEGLLSLVDQLDYPRVAAHAGAAMVNFSEDCPKAIITGYLPDLMAKLEAVLDMTYQALVGKGKKLVLEQVITTIASVADAAQDHFITFYDRLMPPLKYILQNANAENLRLLRGKTIECISLIGLAVGREKFLDDANEIMQMLVNSQVASMPVDDPQVSYMISAWARICKLLGDQFAKYLPLVMPPVMRTAEYKPDVALMNDEEAAQQQNDEDWSFVSLGDQKSFGIRTAGIEDKATACEMLVCYARELKGAFVEYVEPVTRLMIPLLKFLFHDGVRTAAAECLPFLLASAQAKGQPFRAGLWEIILPAYEDAIHGESDLEVLADMLHGVGACVEELGAEIVTGEHLKTIIKMVDEQMNNHEERRKAREKSREQKDEDHDEETEEEMDAELEAEATVLSRVADIMHYCFQVFRESFVPFFDELVDHFKRLLEPKRNYADRQWAICIFDDLIEYGGPNSVKHQAIFYGPMRAALKDEYPEVRQAAAYGFGIMAMYGGNAYAQACAGCLENLNSMICEEDSRSTQESITATENAISAVAKILKYNGSMVDSSKVIPAFVGWLPVYDDHEETPHVYGYFCDLVESNNPILLGENNANLPRILTVVIDSFAHQAFEEGSAAEVRQRMLNIVKFLQKQGEFFDAVVRAAELNEAQTHVLHQLMSLDG